MPELELFPRNQIIGIFRGFQEGGLEFHADLVLPYRHEFQSIPMHGQFVLVQLETPDEAVLGRITAFSSEGKLASGYGEEFNIRALRENRQIPDDLREDYLKYRVNIRVLGVERKQKDGTLQFVASHRRLPHVGSPVAFPSGEVLREIVGHTNDGMVIGYFALGEYIYAQGEHEKERNDGLVTQQWMQLKTPEILIRFPLESLVSRRSFIFARAGFGKSNLNKLLFSSLYKETPLTPKGGGRKVPVGTIIFDADGEYFWPDDRDRPGLCDVPELQDKLVIFTARKGPSPFYDSFIAGDIKLDIRRFRPTDVISIALSPERQEQQNVRKLKGLDQGNWEKLVNLIAQDGNQASLEEIGKLIGLEANRQEVEALAARGNMAAIVSTLHNKSSQLMDMLFAALSEGKLCIVDVSRMRGAQSLILSGLILRRIFDRNQEEFTQAQPKTIPTIVVIEEAQSVLNEKSSAAEPYIAWVKEGRKYDLGALLITQQPGSIPVDILSQGDNWFIFHLLSSADLTALQRANAHFSSDILSVLLNEPIPGQGVFWSSVGGKPYPVSMRARSFENLYTLRDPDRNKPAVHTFAQQFKNTFQQALDGQSSANEEFSPSVAVLESMEDTETVDTLDIYKRKAIEALRQDTNFSKQMSLGIPWGKLGGDIAEKLPDILEERERRNFAFKIAKDTLITLFGQDGEGWHTYKTKNGTTMVKLGKKGENQSPW